MRLLAGLTVVLFCCLQATTADATDFCGFGRSRAVVRVRSAPVNVRVVQRRALFNRRSHVPVNVNVSALHGFHNASSFQFVQPSVFTSFAPVGLSSLYGMGYGGYAGYGSDIDEDDYLNMRLREEIGELDQLRDNIAALKDRLGL